MKPGSSSKRSRPVRLAYDILKLSAGGLNGGIKPHHFAFLRHFSEHHQRDLELHVFCQSELVPELSFLSANPCNQIHVLGSRHDFDFRKSDGSLPPLHFWPHLDGGFLEKWGIDALYGGFGDSRLASPTTPQISLLVDVLHRDRPDDLPPHVAKQRDIDYRNAIAQSDLIQTNSQFCIDSLHRHFEIPKERLFSIYLPLNHRFDNVEIGSLPSSLSNLPHRFFLYPANYWPHKNHLRLLEAYAAYRKACPETPHALALTGNPGETESQIRVLAQKLGIESHVHFLGHSDLPAFIALYELSAAVIFPSLYEGFGIPILEACHFQKPLACSAIASLPEIAPPQALLFDPQNTQEIAQALLALHQDPDQYRPTPDHLKTFHFPTEAEKLKIRILQVASAVPTAKTT
ncbi:glycosyltransferase family 1 protein [Pelagicoccus sp. SDUM812003]|uniref:glycosyltransferase family 4 protein n=1 Tax=Pelagicoccus sp. SDUM812003 TaxID=3041267 RepID=UPI00280E9BB3|nr:glycosyltransferase family 1 protein [Pelagicoccus sp. SDUM812003]MDQ8204255.1 glycosyltransferase family 1 protein [Pelagicoccus sp. SDUM812003]